MSMSDRDGLIWYDGEMVPWREATTHVLTHTLHYGMGCFEGVRAYHAEQGTAIFALEAHTRRLLDSCKVLGMAIPFDKTLLMDAQVAAVRDNNLDSAYIRPMCFYGSEGMGLRADNLSVHCIVAAWEWGSYLGQEGLEKGIRLFYDCSMNIESLASNMSQAGLMQSAGMQVQKMALNHSPSPRSY